MAKKQPKNSVPEQPPKVEVLEPEQARGSELRVEFGTPPKECASVWGPLYTAHGAWLDRYMDGPIYSLPEPIVRELARAVEAVAREHRAKKLYQK